MRTLVLGGIRSGKSRWAEQAIKEAFSFFVVVHQYFSLNDLYEMGGGSVRQRVQR